MLFTASLLCSIYKNSYTLQDGGDVFTREGMPRIPFPNGWKGTNGLYTVGFSQRGLLGASADALNIARDIHCQWKDMSRPGGTNIVLQ